MTVRDLWNDIRLLPARSNELLKDSNPEEYKERLLIGMASCCGSSVKSRISAGTGRNSGHSGKKSEPAGRVLTGVMSCPVWPDGVADMQRPGIGRRPERPGAAWRGEKPDNETNQFATMPDLLLIDGGRGQVSAVKQALRGTALEHVPTFGMVKDDHHRTRAIVDDAGGEIAINRHRNIFTFVTNIQDETHRYANDYRKRMMHKKSYAATLTELPGVGPKTSAALLAHFKTVTAVKQASISDLEEVKGISHAKAENIYNALRQ